MSHSADSSTAGNDKPVICAEEDRYGFNELAVRLTGSIIQLARRISTVIGIEGRWGSGKTSLLNLLLKQMKTDVPDGTHVLQIAPGLHPRVTVPLKPCCSRLRRSVMTERQKATPGGAGAGTNGEKGKRRRWRGR
ncbi:P-loop NTPase fold protein [Klebsiella oxytoca]|uniref:P-loop NTPase fold protein n=1 Tax=Klebsiella oxytoca TaxID=571 RepID=UPI001EEA46FB|nr:P-loop NTPase fold protein [Klebsiella oxytoca]